MPVVPFVQAAPQQGFQLPGPPPDDQWTLMAAAQMHMEGRLIEVAEGSPFGVLPNQPAPNSKDNQSTRDLKKLEDDIEMERKNLPAPMCEPAPDDRVS